MEGMEGWKDGRLESWKIGRLEGWKNGKMEEWKIPHSPTSFAKASAVRGYGGQREWWGDKKNIHQ